MELKQRMSFDLDNIEELEKGLAAVFMDNKLFQEGGDDFVRDIVRVLQPKWFNGPDPPIIKYGDPGKACYILYMGQVEVVSGDNETVLAHMPPGSLFGEVNIFFKIFFLKYFFKIFFLKY